MYNDGEYDRYKPFNQSPCFWGKAPYSKLHKMRFDLIYIFQLQERLFIFQIPHTMPVMEGQFMICRSRENWIVCSICTSPHLLNNILSKLRFKELLNIVRCYQIKSISVFKIFFEQEVLHLSFSLNLLHVDSCNCNYFISQSLASHIKLTELVSYVIQVLNQKAWAFDWIEIKNKDILLALLFYFERQIVKQVLSMSQKHSVCELSDKIALLIQQTIVLIQARNNRYYRLLKLTWINITHYAEEFFVQKSRHIICLEFKSSEEVLCCESKGCSWLRKNEA